MPPHLGHLVTGADQGLGDAARPGGLESRRYRQQISKNCPCRSRSQTTGTRLGFPGRPWRTRAIWRACVAALRRTCLSAGKGPSCWKCGRWQSARAWPTHSKISARSGGFSLHPYRGFDSAELAASQVKGHLRQPRGQAFRRVHDIEWCAAAHKVFSPVAERAGMDDGTPPATTTTAATSKSSEPCSSQAPRQHGLPTPRLYHTIIDRDICPAASSEWNDPEEPTHQVRDVGFARRRPGR